MNENLESMLERLRILEKQIMGELQRKEQEFFYEVRQGKVRFTKEARARHRLLMKRFMAYLRGSRFMVLLTTPVIWFCFVPIAFLDLVMTVYQFICFPIFGIPKVNRSDYIILDRRRLDYLNWAEKLNCEYCGYTNGVLACATEIAARTEQYWCPIKHALRMKSMHSRYRFFFDYGDAEKYREQIETVRRSFEDVDSTSESNSISATHTTMKTPSIILSLIAICALSSCIVGYDEYGPTPPVGIGYYSVLPPSYIGDYYVFGGRYYYGGRYEPGRFHYRGRWYDNRYYHHGHYYYGGRHGHYDGHHR